MSRPAPREPREQGVVRRAAQPHVSHVSRGGQVRERAVCRVSQLVESLTTWAPRRGRRLAHLEMRQTQHMSQASMLTFGSTEWQGGVDDP
jgi:hypothetical protein